MKQIFAYAVGLAVIIAQPTSAQSARPPKPPFATAIASSDSLAMIGAVESPDGRWIIFASGAQNGPSHLWIMPARGGTPRPLTEGNHHDSNPVWFSSGRRIAFVSDRVHGIMTSDFDPVAGRLTGTMKRASIEDALAHDVSPDGMRIVYTDFRKRLRVIPTTGGPAVTILDHSAAGSPLLAFPKFSADGRSVYVSTRGAGGSTIAKLLRVPVGGGQATTAHVGPSNAVFWGIVGHPAADRLMVQSEQVTTILTMRGDTIAVLPAQAGNQLMTFSRDGRRLLKGVTASSTVVRLVPTAGGTPIDVTPGVNYDWPVAWSSDGKQIYSYIGDTTPVRSKPGLMVSSVNGGGRRFMEFSPTDSSAKWLFWRQAVVFDDGRYWAFVPRRPQPTVPVLMYDTRTRTTREITRDAIRILPNPAGLTSGPTELVYLEKRGAAYEVRAVRGEGEPRVIFTSTRLRAPWLVALHGDRIAWGEHVGDSSAVYVTRGAEPERRLVSVAGKVGELAWSPDGKTLAATVNAAQAGGNVKYGVMFVGVGEQGRATQAPWQVATDVAWDLAWLPDSRAVTLLEEQGNTSVTRVLRVPVDPRVQPTSLTPNERASFWGQSPSPDGRWIAIPVERQGASTLWSIDVDAAAKAWREMKARTSSRPRTR